MLFFLRMYTSVFFQKAVFHVINKELPTPKLFEFSRQNRKIIFFLFCGLAQIFILFQNHWLSTFSLILISKRNGRFSHFFTFGCNFGFWLWWILSRWFWWGFLYPWLRGKINGKFQNSWFSRLRKNPHFIQKFTFWKSQF